MSTLHCRAAGQEAKEIDPTAFPQCFALQFRVAWTDVHWPETDRSPAQARGTEPPLTGILRTQINPTAPSVGLRTETALNACPSTGLRSETNPTFSPPTRLRPRQLPTPLNRERVRKRKRLEIPQTKREEGRLKGVSKTTSVTEHSLIRANYLVWFHNTTVLHKSAEPS